jgi:hypothetical protein
MRTIKVTTSKRDEFSSTVFLSNDLDDRVPVGVVTQTARGTWRAMTYTPWANTVCTDRKREAVLFLAAYVGPQHFSGDVVYEFCGHRIAGATKSGIMAP